MALKQSATCYKQKTDIFSLPDHQLAANLILILVSTKGQNRDISKFVAKFVEIRFMIIFMKKSHSNSS